MGLFRRLVLTALATASFSSPALADPALWRVSDDDSDIYLFGSVHIFTREVNWRTPQFDALLKSADHVVFEVVMDVDAYATLTYITMTEGTLPNGELLGDMLDTDEYASLAEVASSVGLEMASLERMQPWLAALTLGQMAMPKASAGVELLVDSEIEPERKRSLETVEEQMALFAGGSREEQIEGLMSTVEGIESGMLADLAPLVDAWESGDTDALKAAMDGFITPRDKAAYAKLIDERNAKWIAPLEKLLAENDNSLVIVGAGHLVGPEGVPALLEGKGYTVERIDAPTAAGSHIDGARR